MFDPSPEDCRLEGGYVSARRKATELGNISQRGFEENVIHCSSLKV